MRKNFLVGGLLNRIYWIFGVVFCGGGMDFGVEVWWYENILLSLFVLKSLST
jgi:hypothetical protein